MKATYAHGGQHPTEGGGELVCFRTLYPEKEYYMGIQQATFSKVMEGKTNKEEAHFYWKPIFVDVGVKHSP